MKKKNNDNNILKKLKKEKNRNYFILYSVTIIVFLILFIYSYLRGYFTIKGFAVEWLLNMLGIIPPILIFDFFNEKLSKDAQTAETTQKITETLMSNPNTLQLFTEQQRRTFIASTISSVVNNEIVSEMLNNSLNRYFDSVKELRICTDFSYSFQLDNKLPTSFDTLSGKNEYYCVKEKLRYHAVYMSEKVKSSIDEIKIAFLFQNVDLDRFLRNNCKLAEVSDFNNCIFRESLDINQADVESLFSLSTSELENTMKNLFKIELFIDGNRLDIKSVLISDTGLLIKFDSSMMEDTYEHNVKLLFQMPKKFGTILEIAIVDPTKAPKISVTYPEDYLDVEVFPFLSKGEETMNEVAHQTNNGNYDIDLSNEWVYPISGLIFTINRNEEN